MYNATNDATWLSAPQRFATRLSVLRRAAMQRYDLFITPRRNVAYSIAALFCSTQRFVCYSAPRLTFTQRSEPQRNATICLLLCSCSTQRNDLFVTFRVSTRRYSARLGTTQRRAPQLNDLFVNLSSLRAAALLDFPQRYALLLNDLFITTQRRHCSPLRHALHRAFAQDHASQFNSTIFLSIYYRASTRLSATNRGATRLAATRSNATQRTET